jgi:CheY-like chemotaxis protein
MVVDDIRFTRLTLVKMLSQFGNPVIHEAADGQAALSVLDKLGGAVDCVLTDLRMPVLDGLGLLKAIRVGSGDIPRDLKVIFLSGQTELDGLGPALLLDLDAFLTKPTSKDALNQCLGRVLAQETGVHRMIAEAAFYRQVDLSPPVIETTSGEQAGDPSNRQEHLLALADVPVDAVLARDVLFSNGRLLLRANTRLTRQCMDSLGELLALSGAAPAVWVLK